METKTITFTRDELHWITESFRRFVDRFESDVEDRRNSPNVHQYSEAHLEDCEKNLAECKAILTKLET